MCAEGAQKCVETIRQAFTRDDRLKSFVRDSANIPGFNGPAFEVRFLSDRVNIHISGSVTYDSSQDINPMHQDPSWTAFGVTYEIKGKAKQKESPAHRLQGAFKASGRPEMTIVDPVIEAGLEVARQ